MMKKKSTKIQMFRGVFAGFLLFIGMLCGLGQNMLNGTPVYAVPNEEQSSHSSGDIPQITTDLDNNSEDDANSDTLETESSSEQTDNNSGSDSNQESVSHAVSADYCDQSMGSLGWIVCPFLEKVSDAIDWLYGRIEGILKIRPIEAKDGNPIYEIWKYCLGITNIIFIIFLLVVVYSQITGWGINNYGIKKVLPKLIVMAILMNLSFLICTLLVDVSNIVGNGVRSVFSTVEQTALVNTGSVVSSTSTAVSMAETYSSMASGAALAIGAGAAIILFEPGVIWMMIPTLLGAIVAVATGLITIALRQAVVILLVMIAPLAFVANLLPNTEQYYQKWKKLLTRMLVFYPLFSLLFGASQLAGFAIIMSANDGFMLLLGLAVQIFPLFFSWKLMQMSGTLLGTINSKLRALTSRPLARNRAWADNKRASSRAHAIAYGTTPSARLLRYMEKRKALREANERNVADIIKHRNEQYVQSKIADSNVGDTASSSKRTSRFTKNAKAARNYALLSQNATAHTEHVMNNYGSYFHNDEQDRKLDEQSQKAFLDHGRASYQREIDDENDISFLVNRYLEANKRDKNNRPVDPIAFNRYIRSVVGPDGEERLVSKIIAQASKAESKQRSEIGIMYAKYGHNGYNKQEFRSFLTGYKINDDGWALDENGEKLKGKDGKNIEIVQGDALTKAPEKLVLYDKRDEQGLYYDFKDQEGNVIARIHRGKGKDGKNHDDGAFLKESMGNNDIPIADPINNVYSILSGVNVGDIKTPQGDNEIGLARYSTTIGRAMNNYKSNAAWAGAMFNTGISNRQIKNSSQHAIWVLDSIKKTLKPGAFNTQNPASVEYITAILDPDNWDKIFTEEELKNAVNINNELVGGEDWTINEDGTISHIAVENPNYEQRMNTLKRKLLFPAMKKVLPSFDRLRTSNTADNQKPGTADAQYEFLKMVKEKWENNPDINFDPTLVDQDLQSEARDFRLRKHDKNGNLIYAPTPDSNNRPVENLLNQMEEAFDRSMLPSDLVRELFLILRSRREYARALERFDELCSENPDATMSEIRDWFVDLDCLVSYHQCNLI